MIIGTKKALEQIKQAIAKNKKITLGEYINNLQKSKRG